MTICSRNREFLFGEIIGGQMRTNETGRMIHSVWYELPKHYPGIGVDVFVVMPNHVHGIVVVGAGPSPRRPRPGGGQPQGVAPTISLPNVVHRFKSMTTAPYRRSLGTKGKDESGGILWQRNYYEHIVRNDGELNEIRVYIATNPQRWAEDRENPQRVNTNASEDELDWL